MISSTQWWMLRPHVHLQMLEEIVILKHSKDLHNILEHATIIYKHFSNSIKLKTRISSASLSEVQECLLSRIHKLHL